MKEQREVKSEVVDGFTRRKEQSKENIRRALEHIDDEKGNCIKKRLDKDR